MKIVLTGGGTAGHVMPHIALMDDFKKNFDSIVYIGSKNGIERSIIEKQNGVCYYPITTTKLVRGKIFANLLIPFKLIGGVHQAKKILKEQRPNVIFSKGGFVSLPVVIAGKRLKIPVVAHESDFYMGLANKLARSKAKVICTTFEETAQREKKRGVYTGSVMRKDMIIEKDEARKRLNLSTTKPVLVITGGSQGSRFINEKIRGNLRDILKEFYVIHIAGKGNLDHRLENIDGYRQYEFTSEIGTLLSASDIVVSRAGSNTIFEIAVLKKPMLLIPLPKGVSRGDQVDNAKYFNKMGYADFVTEEQLANNQILPYIERTYKNREKLESALKKAGFKPANEKLLEIIISSANK